MISCAYPGCPSVGNYQGSDGLWYCWNHLPNRLISCGYPRCPAIGTHRNSDGRFYCRGHLPNPLFSDLAPLREIRLTEDGTGEVSLTDVLAFPPISRVHVRGREN